MRNQVYLSQSQSDGERRWVCRSASNHCAQADWSGRFCQQAAEDSATMSGSPVLRASSHSRSNGVSPGHGAAPVETKRSSLLRCEVGAFCFRNRCDHAVIIPSTLRETETTRTREDFAAGFTVDVMLTMFNQTDVMSLPEHGDNIAKEYLGYPCMLCVTTNKEARISCSSVGNASKTY